MSKLFGEEYAKVVWRAEDVQSINGAWPLEKCEEWLQDNERHISDRLIELGWEVLDVLVRETSYDEEEDESSNVQYKYKTIDESGEHPEYPFGIEWSSDLEGVLIDHIKWYETEEERDRIFNASEALDALKIMEEGDE